MASKSSHLLIFVPGQRLGGQDKPVLLGASLHDADVDGEPAFADHLCGEVDGAERDGGGGGGGARRTVENVRAP